MYHRHRHVSPHARTCGRSPRPRPQIPHRHTVNYLTIYLHRYAGTSVHRRAGTLVRRQYNTYNHTTLPPLFVKLIYVIIYNDILPPPYHHAHAHAGEVVGGGWPGIVVTKKENRPCMISFDVEAMCMRQILKIRQVGLTLVLTIPRDMVKELGWKVGDKVMITKQNDQSLRVQGEK